MCYYIHKEALGYKINIKTLHITINYYLIVLIPTIRTIEISKMEIIGSF